MTSRNQNAPGGDDSALVCEFWFWAQHIAPAITELMRNYPELQVHFELFDRQIDLVQDNIDLDIRINDAIPDYYIAHLLTKNKRILCAAPEYLQNIRSHNPYRN